MNNLFQDLRYAIRMLLKKPGFTVIAVLTLALGIGANTAIFTVVDAALLKGLPYEDPDRLFHLWETTPQKEYSQREASYPDYQDWQKNQAFDSMAAYTGGMATMTGRGDPERVASPSATANFFSVLGVEALIGRTFQPGEDVPGAERVTVLTFGFWQRRFGGDPAILGQSLTLNGNNHIVVGVLPPSFQFALRQADLWRPYQPSEMQLSRRFMHGTNVIARLKDGVTVEKAQAEMSAIGARIEQEHNQSHAGTGIILVPLQEEVVGDVKPVLFVLLAAVGFVLLIACANVANLLLVRSTARRKEMAIRAALGAGRSSLIRQLLTESLLLSIVGGIIGLLIAQWGVEALVAAIPEHQLNTMPYLKGLGLDSGILIFAASLSIATGIVFGLAPALQSSKTDLTEALKEGGRASAASSRNRLRSLLVVTEIALALVLLVGAGLMMRSLMKLLEVDPGFKTENLLTMTVSLPSGKFTEASQVVEFHKQLISRVESLPGVTGAGTVNILPLIGGNTTRFYVEGEPVPPPGEETESNLRTAGSNYFRVMGIPLIKGRHFDERDNVDAPGVLIVNKTLADRVLPGRDIVGRRLAFSGFNIPPVEVVGVVGDVKITGLDDEIKPVIYSPFQQGPSLTTSLVVRTGSDAANLAAAIRSELRSMEPDITLFAVRTMEEMIAVSPATFMRRYPALLIGVFAAVALLLASIGIYGVISYSVGQQTHDIGVRVALGARTSDIIGMVMKQGAGLAVAGVALGLAGAFAVTRLLESMLFEVSATDPVTFALVPALLIGVALLACYIPARRAAKVDPMVALRYE
ncbi:MAG: ABC transporter permease [Blastocatellia bacterium]|nr:ABC transporter permease [Blastocatellia bacterium]